MTDMEDPHGINAYLDEATRAEGSVAGFIRPARKSVARIDLPNIEVQAGLLHVIATEAEAALIKAQAPFYVRGGTLVRPVVDDMPAAHSRRTKVARLSEVAGDVMVDRLSRSAVWLKYNARKKALVAIDPPHNVAATILARDGEWTFPRLAGVITTPTLRPDGTILSEPGYDAATQLLLLDPPKMPVMPSRPTRDDALKSLEMLDRLLDEFPFADEASRSVALSALITPVTRGATSVVPMHATSAPVAGSGKSYIIDLASAINSGERAPVLSAGRNEEETEKRLIAALLSGQTIISIDNVNGDLGGDFLCQVIERPVVGVRPLGQSVFTKVESRASCFATGNNIRLLGDMTRRVLLCSLDPNMERPETRVFASNPFDQVLADRGRYVAAALTVVRAYVIAGCPDPRPTLASFEDWSRLVRSALVWLGQTDPVETMQRARSDDPITAGLTNLLTAWWQAAQSIPHTTAEIKVIAASTGPFDSRANANLHEALLEVADDGRGGVNTKKLGHYLGRHKDRIVGGFKVQPFENSHLGQNSWRVVKV